MHHRLGRTEQARRYYEAVAEFAPNSADVVENLRRLGAGEQPLEQALDSRRALGRWMLFLSEFLTQAETIAGYLSQREPEVGLPSTGGAALLQLGVLLADDADDWRMLAANQVLNARGYDGARRIVDLAPASSVFAPENEIIRASIAVEAEDEAEAARAAERALALGQDRWSIVASVGDIYRQIGQADLRAPP